MARVPRLCVVIPCYNEQEVLPVTSGLFKQEVEGLVAAGKVAADSRVLFVNDGSRDDTWETIEGLAASEAVFEGISLSRNRGHQNALLAGLMEARRSFDVTISIDCDGQDDLGAMGVESVYNHADYRLMSRRALDGLAQFREVNLFLRGMVPLVGYRSTSVYYERHERMAGESHYPLSKMLALAVNGITSLSVKPIRIITGLGLVVSVVSFVGVVWALVSAMLGHTIAGWTSTVVIICFMGGIQLLSLGVIGEYVGKIYLEAKGRPRFIVSERTFDYGDGADDADDAGSLDDGSGR